MSIRSLTKKVLSEITIQQWNIGFIDYNPNNFFSTQKFTIKYIKHNYKNKWFADPFILNVTEKEIVVLAEEYDRNIRRGRIAKLVINRDNLRLISMTIILDLETHLSFPVIYRDNDKIYVCPENSESGGYYKYIYDSNSEKLVNPELITKEPLTDAVKCVISDVPHIFSTKLPNPHGNNLYIYSDEDKKEQYKLKQEILLADNTARGAGHFIKLNDKLIRPAQDCNKSYGGGLVFQEIVNLKDGFRVNELKRIYSKSFKYGLGMHTFNTFGSIAVPDELGYKYIILGRIYNGLRVFAKHIYQFLK